MIRKNFRQQQHSYIHCEWRTRASLLALVQKSPLDGTTHQSPRLHSPRLRDGNSHRYRSGHYHTVYITAICIYVYIYIYIYIYIFERKPSIDAT